MFNIVHRGHISARNYPNTAGSYLLTWPLHSLGKVSNNQPSGAVKPTNQLFGAVKPNWPFGVVQAH